VYNSTAAVCVCVWIRAAALCVQVSVQLLVELPALAPAGADGWNLGGVGEAVLLAGSCL
jgi:hypothetical protein